MLKPILLLDVDGVLNVPCKSKVDRDAREIRLEWADGKFISFFPTDLTKPFMWMAWELFDVRWLTAWGSGANMIAKHYHLKVRPAIKYREYKAVGAVVSLQANRWRKVAWIEDGVDSVAKAVIADKGWSYFHCDPFVGVTEKHMNDLKEFASGGAK